MTTFKQKGWRIPQELDQLIRDTKPSDMSESAYVTKVLTEALTTQSLEDKKPPESPAMDALVRQLEVKDEQIEKLSRWLDDAHAETRAAQALHAVDRKDDLLLESAEQKQEQKSRWQRLKDAWRG